MLRVLSSLLFLIGSFSVLDAQMDHPQVAFVKSELQKKNIEADNIFITDHYTSGGITHTYFKETIDGIRIYNSAGAVHHKSGAQIIVKSNFKKYKGDIPAINSKITAEQAIKEVILRKGLDFNGEIVMLDNPIGKERNQKVEDSDLSLMPMEVKLQYLVDRDQLRLVWEFAIEDPQTAWMTDYFVDVLSGEIVMEVDWTVECNHGESEDSVLSKDKHYHHPNCKHSHNILHNKKTTNSSLVPNTYEIYEWPVESPNFGSRSIVTSPWDDNLVASPNGWHTVGANSFTTTVGNNTDAYLDSDNTNGPTGGDAARADGGADLEFIFPLDVNGNPVDYTDAAITNTFYWANLMHDVWFNYGFDEPSGNFQEENYTASGNASDYVQSEVQDGSGTCNANFGTPPDGSRPRMQMFLCNGRDGDFDNGVIAHEYGHGVSNRLTGGPAASGCLGNQEQMGEGWSDYLGIVMTIESGDMDTDSRSVGTWLFGQGPNGAGIRPHPYSTDMVVNPSTYDDIKTFSVPHGVGSVWCTMLWDMTWAFINEYGFDPDIYNGTGGNNMAMQLVIEGMKLQPCSPGFVDGRDAILEADMLLNGGANECIIWNAFANRGLGFSAEQNSTGSRSDGTEAFDLPPSCALKIKKTTTTTTAEETNQIMYQIIVENNFSELDLTDILVTDTIPQDQFFVSASDGGTETSGVISWSLFDLMSNEADTFTVLLEVKTDLSYIVSDIYDDVEGGEANWETTSVGSTSWSTQNTVSNSGTMAWFAPDNSSLGTALLDLAFEVGLGGGSEISFEHQYDTENNWDGGLVLISTDGGEKWTDLGPNMTNNGYNNIIFNSIPGFSGNSNGFINTIIDLDSYEGQNVLIRFQMNCDQAVGGEGWWIDDIALTNLKSLTINEANVTSDIHSANALANGVQLIPPASLFQASLTKTNVECNGDANGEILISPQGGSGNYTYIWSDGETSQNRSNLDGGLYRVTISDGVDQIFKVGIVSEPNEINLDFDVENVTNESGDNGSIEVIATGGNGNFTYLWENGATTPEINGLVDGFYSVTVSDGNNCSMVDSAEVLKISCGDDFFDSGGVNNDYSNSEDITTIICPDNEDEGITITFNSFNVETNWDALYIYNGTSINSPQFSSGNGPTQAGFPAGGYYGTSNPGSFESTDESGCITLRFRSDQFVTEFGWDVDVSCGVLCSESVSKNTNDLWGSLRRTIGCADPGEIITIESSLHLDTINLDNLIIIDKEVKLEMQSGNMCNIGIMSMEPIFEITPSNSLELDNVNLLSSQLTSGGAIINNGTLILNNVKVIENANTPNPQTLIQNNGQLNVTGNTEIIKD